MSDDLAWAESDYTPRKIEPATCPKCSQPHVLTHHCADVEILYEAAKLAQFDACDSIWWRYNEDRTQLNVFAMCSDFFDWGTADLEQITIENLPILRQAIADVQEVSGSEYGNQADGFLLFCARVRKQRPQGAYYQHLHVYHSVPAGLNEYGNPQRGVDVPESERRTLALRALFDACGPERGIDLQNPKDQDGKYRYGEAFNG